MKFPSIRKIIRFIFRNLFAFFRNLFAFAYKILSPIFNISKKLLGYVAPADSTLKIIISILKAPLNFLRWYENFIYTNSLPRKKDNKRLFADKEFQNKMPGKSTPLLYAIIIATVAIGLPLFIANLKNKFYYYTIAPFVVPTTITSMLIFFHHIFATVFMSRMAYFRVPTDFTGDISITTRDENRILSTPEENRDKVAAGILQSYISSVFNSAIICRAKFFYFVLNKFEVFEDAYECRLHYLLHYLVFNLKMPFDTQKFAMVDITTADLKEKPIEQYTGIQISKGVLAFVARDELEARRGKHKPFVLNESRTFYVPAATKRQHRSKRMNSGRRGTAASRPKRR